MDDPLTDYQRFVARLDEHCDRVARRHAQRLVCAEGCASCCHRQLTVFAIEAESIRRWIRAQGGLAPFDGVPAGKSGHPSLLLASEEPPCALLDRAGRCRIYPVRPVICRSHGLPIAAKQEKGGVQGDVCPLNFAEGEGLRDVPSEDFLSLDTTNTVLAALNARFELESDGESATRVALAELLDC